jgi:hypothetical protein
MKVEIGESLMLSWLRHAKNCQMVQLNWKPSVKTWELYNEVTVESIMKETDVYFSERHGLNLFKKTSSFSQLIQLGEIDALGLEIDNGVVKNTYAIDVAFHESGLNYGSKEETIARVIKKMIRTAMILHGYFNISRGEIIFASPKVYDNIGTPLREHMLELNDFFQRWGLVFSFSLICNEEFRDKIFNVVTALSNTIADTSELFMRAIQMYNMFGNQGVTVKLVKERKQGTDNTYKDFNGFEEMKIGILVKSSFVRLIDNDLIPLLEVDRLQRVDYSKKIFNVNYPVLKAYDANDTLSNQRNINGYPRYYSDIYVIQDKSYLLCNHWVEEHSRSFFEAWLKQIHGE